MGQRFGAYRALNPVFSQSDSALIAFNRTTVGRKFQRLESWSAAYLRLQKRKVA